MVEGRNTSPEPVTAGVLLIGFGGPDRPEDLRPFLTNVLRGRPVPPHRLDEIVKQYERIGGRSPYNELVDDLAMGLGARLAADGAPLPVYVGMRNWAPALTETLARAKGDGVTDLVCVVLASYRSIPSWNYYLRSTAEAYHAAVGRGLRLHYLQPWHADPRFSDAAVERVSEALRNIAPAGRDRLRCLFTAHSIPVPWNEASGYSRQIADLAARVADRCDLRDWRLVYQSRSGRPEDRWLEPDISQALAAEDPAGRDVLVVPLGFLMDHVEVLFDLDMKAREAAEARGWRFHRAKTVGTHPIFLDMLSRKVREKRLPAFSPAPRRVSPGRRVVVVGAGISGLAAAHRLGELSRERGETIALTVLDAASRAGGVIETGRRDGFLWEGGPDSFITEKPAALQLAGRLGLESEIRATRRQHRQSFVARNGRLYPTPEGFYLLAPSKLWPLARTPLLSWPGKLRAALEFFLPPRRGGGDETLASFVRRRFGREILERLAQPLVAGIYSADSEELSLEATFPKFLEMEARSGGVLRAMLKTASSNGKSGTAGSAGTASGPRYGLFATFQNGVDTLVQALLNNLPAGALRTGSRVEGLERSGEGWRLRLSGGEALQADAVVLALPGPETSALLRTTAPGISRLLDGIPYASVATVNVAFDREMIRHPLNGFGFVVPALEKRAVTGCTFAQVKFDGRAPEFAALFRAFVGGDALGLDDTGLRNAVLRDLEEFIGAEGPPLWTILRRYPAAMPHYRLGHLQRVRQIFEQASGATGLALAGNAYNGIGLPDCVASGERAAEAAFAAVFSTTPKGLVNA